MKKIWGNKGINKNKKMIRTKKEVWVEMFPFGEMCEKLVIEYLETNHKTFLMERRNDNKYDFMMATKNGIYTYEVKGDNFCVAPTILNGRKIQGTDSGNMFIEFQQSELPSGIEVTTADWFVYYYYHLDKLYFIKTEKLRELIAQNQFVIGTVWYDKKPNLGYLIPRDKFAHHFIICDIE